MILIDNMNSSKVKVSVSESDSDSSSSEESVNDDTMRTKKDLNEEHGSTSDDNSGSDNNDLVTNEGWADSIAKILGSNKPKKKKTLVLSRAKKYSEIIKTEKEEKPAFEVIDEIKEEKSKKQTSVKVESGPQPKKKKFEKASIRVKPNILERDRERLLSKIATKGVVQLFNAVRNQQRSLEKTEQSDVSVTKKSKITKKFDKRTFLDSLMGSTKSVIVDEVTNSDNNGLKDENKPKWNALRDDFMMGAKMKDWDKDAGDE